jgi:hypothetical protein
MILNFAGGIVGGIWLAFLGEWGLIGIGVVLLFVSNWILSFFMIPSMILSSIGMKFYGKNKFLVLLFGYISQLYINILIIATCVFAFLICSSFYNGNTYFEFIPYLLWSWGMALGPWQFFASKELDNEFSIITVFIASIFYFLFLISLAMNPAISLIVLIIFGIIQLIVLPVFNLSVATRMDQQEEMDIF